MSAEHSKESESTTWLVVSLLVLFVLFKGFFAFWVVKDLGQPTWDYRPIADVPGESAYAVHAESAAPQHIRGKGGE